LPRLLGPVRVRSRRAKNTIVPFHLFSNSERNIVRGRGKFASTTRTFCSVTLLTSRNSPSVKPAMTGKRALESSRQPTRDAPPASPRLFAQLTIAATVAGPGPHLLRTASISASIPCQRSNRTRVNSPESMPCVPLSFAVIFSLHRGTAALADRRAQRYVLWFGFVMSGCCCSMPDALCVTSAPCFELLPSLNPAAAY